MFYSLEQFASEVGFCFYVFFDFTDEAVCFIVSSYLEEVLGFSIFIAVEAEACLGDVGEFFACVSGEHVVESYNGAFPLVDDFCDVFGGYLVYGFF